MTKRVVVEHYGGPDVLKVVEGPDPKPGVGEVVVKVLAAGVSFTDAQLRALSKANPLTYVVSAERELFDGVIDRTVAGGFLAATAVCVVGLLVGVRVMRSGTAG